MKSQRDGIFSFLLVLLSLCSPLILQAQASDPALVGYFQNWQDPASPYIDLDDVDSRYNMITVAFALPKPGTDYDMEFTPDNVSQETFIAQMRRVQEEGRKVIISVGGANNPISLDDENERETFVGSVGDILDTYGFDGMDIDLEGSSLSISGGSISSPIDEPIINLIDAIREIMQNYRLANDRRLILTMAPETAFVQGGQSGFGGIWGGYLPVIDRLRDSIDILHVQLYNSGSMWGIDGNIYEQGTADFIVAMCEAVIRGFSTNGGTFEGIPASKVAVGLPACGSAAGGGYVDTETLVAAVKYLRGEGERPGSYELAEPDGYPDLRGLMTWSVNWDALSTCGDTYAFAGAFRSIYGLGSTTSVESIASATGRSSAVYPNPVRNRLHVIVPEQLSLPARFSVCNVRGEECLVGTIGEGERRIDISHLVPGAYYLKIEDSVQSIIVE